MAAAKNAKRGLGKGIDSLIPAKVTPAKEKATKEVAAPVEGQVTNVNITKIQPNSDQPRKNFDEDKLLELADSIKQHGVLVPLIVVDRGDHYEIVGGERRWRAAMKLGLKEVPVIVRNLNEQEIAEIALIDNLQRADINAIEEALAFKRLIDEFGYTQELVAEKVSKSRVYITNSLRLLKLCENVRQMVIDEQITNGHARALIPIEDPDKQFQIAQEVFDKKLSVRETEKLVKNLGKPAKKKASNKNDSLDVIYASVAEKCKQAIGTKVDIISKGDGSGKIEIEFYSNDDLEKITDRLCKE